MVWRYILIFALFIINFAVNAKIQEPSQSNFIALADIHFNPFYSCDKKVIYCPVIKQLKNTRVNYWGSVLAHYDNGKLSSYGNDTNYPLLRSALAAMRLNSIQNQPKFILILGDFLSHNYKIDYQLYSGDLSQSGYEAFVKKTIKFLTMQIQNTFPNTPVYPVVGNNDSYTEDYGIEPNGKFFKDLTKIWTPLLHGNRGTFYQTFPIAGYYSLTPVNEPKLRILVLNSVLFAKPGTLQNQKAALQQLSWLKTQLQSASQQRQKVWLVAHVPVGINVFYTVKSMRNNIISFWLDNYTTIFQQIVSQYSTNIAGILTGHLHMDGFQFIKATNSIPNSFVPSISPRFGNNPSFKQYDYSIDNAELQDFTTYYLNMLAGDHWQKEYKFRDIYQPKCNTCNLSDRMQTIKKKGLTAQAYRTFYAVSTHSQPITEGKWLPYYWCAIHNARVSEYQSCIEK